MNPLMHRTSIVLVSVGSTVVLAVFVAVAVAYSGLIDVSATSPPSGLTRWLLATTQQRSVASRSAHLNAPQLNSPNRIAEGAEHYREMCVGCHGAPGVERSEIGQGLEPKPPSLFEGGFNDNVARQTFWVVKNGIQMTGMPAFGPTHSDEKIWDVVAFVRRLKSMTPAQYAKETADHDHHHSSEAREESEHARD